MNVPIWVWAVTVGVAMVILLVDVLIIGRRPHEPSMKEASTHLAFYVSLAVLFGLGVWYFSGATFAGEYFAGWLTEYSLSVDNLFVFILIMNAFAVPRKYQQTALMVGIVIALILRAVFIAAGAAMIQQFSWMFYLFGAFLVYTAITMIKNIGEDEEYEENRFIAFAKRRLRTTEDYHGAKAFVMIDGKRYITPMLLTFLALGTTDLIFALDSIPAIFGLTQEPFLVLMANIFALMGLRQLYFLIGGLMQKLIYLTHGLSFLLAFIGVKLFLHAMHVNELPFINGGEHIKWAPEIGIIPSLSVIIGTLVITTVLSLVVSGRREKNALKDADADS